MVKIVSHIRQYNPETDREQVQRLLRLDASRTLYVDMSDSVSPGALGNGALESLCTASTVSHSNLSFLVYDPSKDIDRIKGVIPPGSGRSTRARKRSLPQSPRPPWPSGRGFAGSSGERRRRM